MSSVILNAFDTADYEWVNTLNVILKIIKEACYIAFFIIFKEGSFALCDSDIVEVYVTFACLLKLEVILLAFNWSEEQVNILEVTCAVYCST